MAPALFGLAGIIAAGLLTLLGVLRTSAPSAHMADIEGLRALVQETRQELEYVRSERDIARAQLKACREERARLRARLEGDE